MPIFIDLDLTALKNQTDVRFAEWIYMKRYMRLDLMKLSKILTMQIHCSTVLNDQCITSKQNYKVHSLTRFAIFGNTSAFFFNPSATSKIIINL